LRLPVTLILVLRRFPFLLTATYAATLALGYSNRMIDTCYIVSTYEDTYSLILYEGKFTVK